MSSQDVRRSSSNHEAHAALKDDNPPQQSYTRRAHNHQQQQQRRYNHNEPNRSQHQRSYDRRDDRRDDRFKHQSQAPSRSHAASADRPPHSARALQHQHQQPHSHPDEEEKCVSIDEQLVSDLRELGFRELDVRDALLIHEGNADAAALWLFAQQQQRLEPAAISKKPLRVPASSATPALKFRIGTSVSVDPAASHPASAQPDPSWLENMAALQQARSRPQPAPSAAASSMLPLEPSQPVPPQPPLPAGLQSVAARREAQDAADASLATQRTKQYLLAEQLTRAVSDPFMPEDDAQAGCASGAERKQADRASFARSKRELLASMLDSEDASTDHFASASPWLQLVAADPVAALAAIQDPLQADRCFSDAELVATDARGWNAVHYCCANASAAHARLLQALLSLPLRSAASASDASAAALRAPSGPARAVAAESVESDSDAEADDSDASDAESNQSDKPHSNSSDEGAAASVQPSTHVRLLFDPQALTARRSSGVHLCCRSSAHSSLAVLLRRNVLLDVKDSRGNRPLHYASALGDVEALEMLLAPRSDSHRAPPHPHVKNKSGQTPLHLAAAFGHLRVVTMLHRLDRSLLHVRDRAHNLPFHLSLGFDDVVHFLLRNDHPIGSASNSSADGLNQTTTRSASLASLTHSCGSAMVNSLTASAQCALSLALALPPSIAESTLRLLLAMDASPNPHGLGLPTFGLVGHASQASHEVLGSYDLAKVVNFKLRARPAMLRKKAAAMQQHSASAVSSAARVQKLKQYTTPLHDAALLGLGFAASLLLQHGAPLDAPSHPHRNSPLQYACRGGHLAVVDLLLRHGADRARLNALGGSSLMFAARGGHHAVVRRLLTPDVSISHAALDALRQHVDPRGETALSLALSSGMEIDHALTVQTLVRLDAAVINGAVMAVVQARIDESTRALEGSSSASLRRGLAALLCAEADATNTFSPAAPPFSDVDLRCADGVLLPAHQCVLGARCEVLLGLMQQKARQDGSSARLELQMPHVSASIMHLLLQFLYRGVLPRALTPDSLVRLMLLANELLLARLMSLCVEVAAVNGWLSADAQGKSNVMDTAASPAASSSASSLSPSPPPMSTLTQLQSLLAPHMHDYLQSHAMQQADHTRLAAESDPNVAVDAAVTLDCPAPSASPAPSAADDDALPGLCSSWLPLSLPRAEEFVLEPLHQLDDDCLRMLRAARHIASDVILVPTDDDAATSGATCAGGLDDDDDDDDGGAAASDAGRYTGGRMFFAHRCMLVIASPQLSALCAAASAAAASHSSSASSSPLRVRVPLISSHLHFLLGCIYGHSRCLEMMPSAMMGCGAEAAASVWRLESERGCESSSVWRLEDVAQCMSLVSSWLDPRSEASAAFKSQLVAVLPDLMRGSDAVGGGPMLSSAAVQAEHDRWAPVQSFAVMLAAVRNDSAAAAASVGHRAEYIRSSALLGLLRASRAQSGFSCVFFRLVKEGLLSWNELCVPIADSGAGLALKQHLQATHPMQPPLSLQRSESLSALDAEADAEEKSSKRHDDPQEDQRHFPQSHVCLMMQLLDWSHDAGAEPTICPCLRSRA